MIERLSSKKIAKARETFYFADVGIFFTCPIYLYFIIVTEKYAYLGVLKSQVTIKRAYERH